jgi:hypothetical protein
MNKWTVILGCAVSIVVSVANAQSIPQDVEVSAIHSLRTNEKLEMKAYKSIRIDQGFKMAPGSSLRLELVPQEKNESVTPDKELVVYPNPSSGKITIQGTFLNDALTIYDQAGNPVMGADLNGENPSVDISGLKKDQYFIKVSKSQNATRLIKN